MKNSDLNTNKNTSALTEENLDFNYEKDHAENKKRTSLLHLVKSGKIFHKKDLWVYFSLAITIACLFLFFLLPSFSKSDAYGFSITRNGQSVLIFNAKSSQRFSVAQEFIDQVEIEDSGKGIYTVKIFSSAKKTGYNVLLFDTNKVSVKVIESTCSDSKDCVYCPEICRSGSIYCAPHYLKIKPISGSGFIPPTTG